jgi:phospholipase A-2-activating protein
VSALAFSPPGASPAFPDGALVSGSRDASVLVWDTAAAAPVQRLEGHKYQVTAVVVALPSGDIASASLDKTVRVWRGGACGATLEGHEGAVLALAALPGGRTLASGSGDRAIKFWDLDDGSCTGTLAAHADTVRGLAALPGLGLVSASHDTSLKVWTLAGECLAEMAGHTAIVYCAAASADGSLVASGSEDNTARVWRPGGSCVATLEHPGCVWAAAFLPNGDLATACSDGVARVWSRDPARAAPADVAEAYAAALAARKAAAAAAAAGGGGGGGGGLPDGLKLEDAAALQTPGTRDGQTLVVSEGGAGVAYSWDAGNTTWERIGEVVAGPDGGGGGGGSAGGRKQHQGRAWDFVFDVDVAEGSPPLKLAMDADENPYIVADRFIDANDLPAAYREQIVQFILQNTGGAGGGGAAAPGQYVDPYTGASAYVPGSAPAAGAGQPGFGGAAPGGGVTGGGVDPFTGGGGGGGGGGAARHTPARACMLYDASPSAEGLVKKVAEFNAALAADEATAALALPAADLGAGGALEALLRRAAAPAGSRAFTDADVDLVRRMLTWPVPQLFPALDLARLVVLDPACAAALATGPVSADAPPGSLGAAVFAATSADPPVPASLQTALRAAANAAAAPAGAAWLHAAAAPLLAAAAGAAGSGAKGVRQGLATLLVNLAVVLARVVRDELEVKANMLALAGALLVATPADDPETRYRCGLGWAGLGWAGLGWAGCVLGCACAVKRAGGGFCV